MLFKIQLIALAGLLPHVLGQTRNNGQACSDSTYYEPDPATYKAGNRVPVPKDEAISPDGFSHNFGEGVIGTVHFEHFTSSDKTSYYSLHVRIDNGANTRKTVLLGSYYHEDPKDPTTVPGGSRCRLRGPNQEQ